MNVRLLARFSLHTDKGQLHVMMGMGTAETPWVVAGNRHAPASYRPSTPDKGHQSRLRLLPTSRAAARIKANFRRIRGLVPVYTVFIRSVYSVYLARSPLCAHCCHGVWSNATPHCSNTRPVNVERKEGGKEEGEKWKELSNHGET